MKLAILLASIWTVMLALGQQSQSFCAVRLTVTTPGGTPIIAGEAQLVDDRGAIVRVAGIVNGRVNFCDFGFGPYSIRVQSDTKMPVTVSGIRLLYGVEQHLAVVMNPLPDSGSEVSGGNACRAYIRMQSPEGTAISNGTARYNGATFLADEFGRVLLLVPLRQFTAFLFERPGFKSHKITLSCNSSAETLERTVVLVRQHR